MAVKCLETQEKAEDGTVVTKQTETPKQMREPFRMLENTKVGLEAPTLNPERILKKEQCEYGLKMHALRDITKGEQILCN